MGPRGFIRHRIAALKAHRQAQGWRHGCVHGWDPGMCTRESSHMSSVCFASGVPDTLSTALPLQRWLPCPVNKGYLGTVITHSSFGLFWSSINGCLLQGMRFHGKQVLGMCLLPQPVQTSDGELCSQCCHTSKQCKEGCGGPSFLYSPVLDDPIAGIIMSFPEYFERSYNEFKDT